MASFEWKKLNSEVLVKGTTKKLFNKYFCTAKYFCPGGRIILHPNNITPEVIQEAIQFRKEYYKIYNYGGSWRTMRDKADLINQQQLLDFLKTKDQHEDTTKFRVEEPYLTIYTETETELYDICANELSAWQHFLKTVCRPESVEVATLIDNGAIIVKSKLDYRYKFVCKGGTVNNKQAIYSYLDNLADQVRVSKTVWTMLERPGSYVWNVWFYANDPTIANMLNIIEPNFVTNIHEVVQA